MRISRRVCRLDGSGAGISATDESFVINPETLLTAVKVYIDNSVGGYSNASGGTEQLYYRVFYSDGTLSDTATITINLTDALVTRVENNIRQQRPRGKCHPVGEGADVEMAEIPGGVIDFARREVRFPSALASETAAASASGPRG